MANPCKITCFNSIQKVKDTTGEPTITNLLSSGSIPKENYEPRHKHRLIIDTLRYGCNVDLKKKKRYQVYQLFVALVLK